MAAFRLPSGRIVIRGAVTIALTSIIIGMIVLWTISHHPPACVEQASLGPFYFTSTTHRNMQYVPGCLTHGAIWIQSTRTHEWIKERDATEQDIIAIRAAIRTATQEAAQAKRRQAARRAAQAEQHRRAVIEGRE
jgi:hypothetical protein